MADTLTEADRGAPHPADFVPDTVRPPDQPLGYVAGIFATINNPLTSWPRQMFETPYHAVPWLGRRFHYLRSPEHMKAVLLDHADAFEKSPFQRRLLRPATGDGLLTSEGEDWRFQRRAAAPAFRIDALRALTPTFSEAGRTAGERLRALAPAGGPPARLDVMSEMNRATLDVIVQTMMGARDPGFDHARVSTALTAYMHSLGHPDLLDMFGAPDWIPRPWAEKGRRAARDLQKASVDAINRRRASGETKTDLLGLLLAARDPETGEGLSDLQLRDNVVTFIGAGHETTALALTYTLYLIANSPAVQDRLHEEAVAVCGNGDATAEQVERMPFHEMVVKEAMRLYPPVSIIDRVAIRDITIGDMAYRKGDLAMMLVYVMHRHQLLWDRPAHFDPDRFSPERSEGRHRFAYMPFGAGPRICIGMKFAYLEAVAILSHLVRAVRFLPEPGHRVTPNVRITLRPEGGMPLRVAAR